MRPRVAPHTAARVRAPALALALAFACAGCGPALVWSGKTPDRLHRIDVIKQSGIEWVMVDGRRRAAYRAIAAWSLAMSHDGRHLAYAARLAGRWLVVHDGHPGRGWDGIGEIVLSPAGRLAYAAEQGGRWHVVVDGRAGPAWDALLAGTLRFSPDGARVAYAASNDAGVHVVVDGRIGPAWDGVGQLGFGAGGAHLVYAARRGDQRRAVVDGAMDPPFDELAHLEPGARGGACQRSTPAWARRAGTWS